MSRGPITLTTDFGHSDHFVGTMKGVILGIAPRVRIVDITHDIAPFDLNEAAFVIAQTWRYFPKGSIHIVVVDPGVGSSRHPILVEAEGHYFVGPDNGIFSMIYEASKYKVRAITNSKLGLRNVSRTFHGRDVFAPAAAHLAAGIPPAKFGKVMDDCVRSSGSKPTQFRPHAWNGTVLKADRFGNLITNFHIDQYGDLRTRAFELKIGLHQTRRLALAYADGEIGELVAIVGSSGYIEVSANQASAASILGCSAGAPAALEIFYS